MQIFNMNLFFKVFSHGANNRIQSTPPLITLVTRVHIRNMISTCFECCRLLFKEEFNGVFFSIYRYPNDKAAMFVFWLDCWVFNFSCIQHRFIYWNMCDVQVRNRTEDQSMMKIADIKKDKYSIIMHITLRE